MTLFLTFKIYTPVKTINVQVQNVFYSRLLKGRGEDIVIGSVCLSVHMIGKQYIGPGPCGSIHGWIHLKVDLDQ